MKIPKDITNDSSVKDINKFQLGIWRMMAHGEIVESRHLTRHEVMRITAHPHDE